MIAFGLSMFVGLTLLSGWAVMIALGILHSYFVRVPAVGFWAALVLTFATQCVTSHGPKLSPDDK